MRYFQKEVGYVPSKRDKDGFYLVRDNWNDFFEYRNMYDLYYVNIDNILYIGKTKIGLAGLKSYSVDDPIKGHDLLEIPKEFQSLSVNYFSVGQSVDFYKNMSEINPTDSKAYYENIKDMSYNPIILEKYNSEECMYRSILRSVSYSAIKEQFNRVAHGGSVLTEFDFQFKLAGLEEPLSFKIKPESLPPSNIHVIIGRNGVGKSHLLNKMIDAAINDSAEENSKNYFCYDEKRINGLFSKVVGFSFSAFDNSMDPESRVQSRTQIGYDFIGIQTIGENSQKTNRSLDDLAKDFAKSMDHIRNNNKADRWLDAIGAISKDGYMNEFYLKELVKNDFDQKWLEDFFKHRLSSGHKIVLLTITKLVEKVEEKTLVLLDEPETHLHPPLISGLTRAISNLMMNRNGVALITTHSPVILQEVPRNCVWIVNRFGEITTIDRPLVETFGENVGKITHDVFKLELTNSSYISLIKDAVHKHDSIEAIINEFNHELGNEAISLAYQLLFEKQKESRDE